MERFMLHPRKKKKILFSLLKNEIVSMFNQNHLIMWISSHIFYLSTFLSNFLIKYEILSERDFSLLIVIWYFYIINLYASLVNPRWCIIILSYWIIILLDARWASLVAQMVKNLCAMFPWRREWLPSPVFLPGEF